MTTGYRDKRRHFFFAMEPQIYGLRGAKELKIDSTYKIVEKPFKQLMSIHILIDNGVSKRTYPMGYVLMSGKRKCDYLGVFKRLKSYLEQDNEKMNVISILMDFESAAWIAARKVFGKDDMNLVRGCWFHFCQAIYRHTCELGLKKDFMKKRDIYNIVRRLMTLALMDPDVIIPLFQVCKSASRRYNNDAIDKLFQYVQDQWIYGTNM